MADHAGGTRGLARGAGFAVVRATSRWSYADRSATLDGLTGRGRPGLTFRSFEDVGEAAFLAALERVSADTADARIQADRERLGPAGEAREMLDDLRSMEWQPGWWELAFDPDGDLVGLIMPTRAPGMTTIGYVSVVPEQGGRRYVDDLKNLDAAIEWAARLPHLACGSVEIRPSM